MNAHSFELFIKKKSFYTISPLDSLCATITLQSLHQQQFQLAKKDAHKTFSQIKIQNIPHLIQKYTETAFHVF